MADVRGQTATEVVGDELVRPLELADEGRLPAQELRGDRLLEPFPLELVARVDGAVARGNLVEAVDTLSRIRQAMGQDAGVVSGAQPDVRDTGVQPARR